MKGFSVRPLVPGRPVRIISGLAKFLFGLFKAGLWGSSRPDRDGIEGCHAPGLKNVFYCFLMGTGAFLKITSMKLVTKAKNKSHGGRIATKHGGDASKPKDVIPFDDNTKRRG